MNDRDPVVAACAIELVRETKRESLLPDLEQALATRDPKDRCVIEAASCVLAGFRGREVSPLGFERVPTVEVVRRLRKNPLFDFASLDELFRIAASIRQVRYDAEQVLFEEGAPPSSISLLIEGRLKKREAGGGQTEVTPPVILGFEEVLEGKPMPLTVRAAEGAVCLVLEGDEFLDLLSNNMELARGLSRTLLGVRLTGRLPLVLKGGVRRLRGDHEHAAPARLKPIEKALVLQELPLFRRATAEELLELAAIAREIAFVPDSLLFDESTPPSFFVVLSGQLSVQSPGGESSTVAEAGDAVGVYEPLAEIGSGWRGRVTRPGTALRLDRDELFDLHVDRVEILQSIFSVPLHNAPEQLKALERNVRP